MSSLILAVYMWQDGYFADNLEKEDSVEQSAETAVADAEKDVPKPQALHQTLSIYLRNLLPIITRQEVEAVISERIFLR